MKKDKIIKELQLIGSKFSKYVIDAINHKLTKSEILNSLIFSVDIYSMDDIDNETPKEIKKIIKIIKKWKEGK